VPRQERARSTVDIILEAAARVLVEDGYDRATTRRIAEVAGVSIGSLYQYFPSKAELVVELASRQAMRITGRLAEQARSLENAPIEAVARAFVTAVVVSYRENPLLYQLTLKEIPRLQKMQRFTDIERQVEVLASSVLARYLDQIRPRDVAFTAFVLTRSVRAVVWSALIDRPEALSSPIFIDELTALVLGFLRTSSSTRAGT
jgi:AcrR family transcriptional regulator